MACSESSLSCISSEGVANWDSFLPIAPRKSPMTAMSGLKTLEDPAGAGVGASGGGGGSAVGDGEGSGEAAGVSGVTCPAAAGRAEADTAKKANVVTAIAREMDPWL